MTSKSFIQWLQKNRVIETILHDSMHIEIIKRVDCLLKFMAKHKAFKDSYIELIW